MDCFVAFVPRNDMIFHCHSEAEPKNLIKFQELILLPMLEFS